LGGKENDYKEEGGLIKNDDLKMKSKTSRKLI
jgi:hypothetical protein